jgi:seryl-tRNA synthetase
MGIKTDYLKDCITGNSITVQDIINLRNSISSLPDSDLLLNQMKAELQKVEAEIEKKFQDFKKEIKEEVKEQIELLKKDIEKIKKKIEEIYNKVVAFRFKNIKEIQRNMNNDIVKITFSDDSYIEVEYNNLPYENEYINYMPSKLNYYDSNQNLIAMEGISYQNESIIGTFNKNF